MFDHTVNFDDMNSWEYFGIVFETLNIGSPEPQLILIDVPFRNGSLDETDYFGDVTYKDRDITMDFLIPWYVKDHHAIYSKVLNRLNGKRRKIRFSADQEWYYEGRLKVGDLSHNGDFWAFSIDATVDPYKYKDTITNYTFGSSISIKLYNELMKTVPVLETDQNITVIFENKSIDFTAGRHKHSGIVLKEGYNYLTVQSQNQTALSFEYRQGRL